MLAVGFIHAKSILVFSEYYFKFILMIPPSLPPCFLSPVPRTTSFYGKRWRWKNCPGLFSRSSTVDAHTGSWGCSSTWNTRMFVLAVQHAHRQTDRRWYWSASLVSAGHRAAGRLHTCRSVGGLQRAVNSPRLLRFPVHNWGRGCVGIGDPGEKHACSNVWLLPWQLHVLL